ncbi:hypothetical protein J8M21_01000 [Pseudoalteromonas luteoviolacea]|uniref:hypothetical protein n=1 Tax=Pseudoalteromonas luteoviolacea TaxID=43657 RepID=UPI001B35A260|nr:hypothetical protein [Pseudoalteromonas luteoviolacea]MBQ4875778.1 hypothetical protein [Pseudoalteromonas luteoviolacea]MBQ4904813.1 hypothetical protein [Pseudoalteromonas luteoviolacea]
MKKAFILSALAALSLNVHATDLSKTYLEIGYSKSDFKEEKYFDKTDYDLVGHQLSLSYEFENGIYAGLHTKRHRETFLVDLFDQDVELDENLVELGYVAHKAQSGRFSIGAFIGALDLSVEDNSNDADLYRVYTEYDHCFNQYFSAFAKLGYESVDGEGASSENGLWTEVGIRAHWGSSSLSWEFSQGEVVEQVAFVYRYSF